MYATFTVAYATDELGMSKGVVLGAVVLAVLAACGEDSTDPDADFDAFVGTYVLARALLHTQLAVVPGERRRRAVHLQVIGVRPVEETEPELGP